MSLLEWLEAFNGTDDFSNETLLDFKSNVNSCADLRAQIKLVQLKFATCVRVYDDASRNVSFLESSASDIEVMLGRISLNKTQKNFLALALQSVDGVRTEFEKYTSNVESSSNVTGRVHGVFKSLRSVVLEFCGCRGKGNKSKFRFQNKNK